MKKLLILTMLVLSLSLVSCKANDGKKETKVDDKKVTEEIENNKNKESKKILGIDDVWEVKGQWTLTIDSVEATSDRNPYAEKEPAEVVIVKYSYENLGYERDETDLYLTPSSIMDGSGEMGFFYAAEITTYPQETPIGGKMIGAEEAFGLNNVSDTVKITFDTYDGNSEHQKIMFECQVTK